MDDLCRELDPYVDAPATPAQAATDETLKAEFLQHLYQQSGRTCGTFSGLWADFRQQCLQEHLDALAEQLAQEKRRVWGEREQRKGGES